MRIEWTYKYPLGKNRHTEETYCANIPEDTHYHVFRDRIYWDQVSQVGDWVASTGYDFTGSTLSALEKEETHTTG